MFLRYQGSLPSAVHRMGALALGIVVPASASGGAACLRVASLIIMNVGSQKRNSLRRTGGAPTIGANGMP